MRAWANSPLAAVALLQAFLYASNAYAFSFTFSTEPAQCQPLTVTVDGGTPPYRLLIIPAGPMPNGATEIRKIIDEEFTDKTHTLNAFTLPANSQYIAMVSDAKGVGTGGTSAITNVADSNDTSCLPTTTPKPLFFIFLNPETYTECTPVTITWDTPQGDVTLAGVIPGGLSFNIPVQSGATSATWLPQVEPGTQVFIVAGDSRGAGTGGSSPAQAVREGSASCLNGGAYSSTNSPYAGQVSSTSNAPHNTQTNTGSEDGKKDNVPIIVGVVVGVIALLALLGAVFYLRYRRKKHPARYGNKVDLFKGDGDEGHDEQPPARLEATPFIPPPPTAHSLDHRTSFESALHGRPSDSTWRSGAPLVSVNDPNNPNAIGDHPPSAFFNNRNSAALTQTGLTSTWDDETGTNFSFAHNNGRPGTPNTALSVADTAMSAAGGAGRRKEAPPRLRPVNFVQHQDAGAIEPGEEPQSPEVVELPPSYTDVRRTSGTP